MFEMRMTKLDAQIIKDYKIIVQNLKFAHHRKFSDLINKKKIKILNVKII